MLYHQIHKYSKNIDRVKHDLTFRKFIFKLKRLEANDSQHVLAFNPCPFLNSPHNQSLSIHVSDRAPLIAPTVQTSRAFCFSTPVLHLHPSYGSVTAYDLIMQVLERCCFVWIVFKRLHGGVEVIRSPLHLNLATETENGRYLFTLDLIDLSQS